MTHPCWWIAVCSTALVGGCAATDTVTTVEATSLRGAPLHRPSVPADRRAALEADLDVARAAYEANPRDETAAIWHGRRLAYLGRYREAIAVFTLGLEAHPRSHKLLRHRGHRYITIRQFDHAISDLTAAAGLIRGIPDEIEPDGAPNARGIPRSTNHSNIYYHLGLAHYLKGDFPASADSFRRCLEFSRVNDDMLVATSYWLYLALRRSGQDGGPVLGPIRAGMDVIENQDYYRLLLLFRGDLTPDAVRVAPGGGAVSDATIGYGLGVWHLINGRSGPAREEFQRVVRAPNWAPFGVIAAEAELAR